jgi:hypothetical protein
MIPNELEWQQRLTDFVTADAKYKQAEKAFNRSVRIAERLSKNMPGDENRAWKIAGVALADERDIRPLSGSQGCALRVAACAARQGHTRSDKGARRDLVF